MSYTELLIHLVFRTYRSAPTLPTDERVKVLYQIIWGIIKNKGGRMYRINSMPDHVHVLFTTPPTIALSEFVKAIKASSSKTIKTEIGFERFDAWGEGYAALSCNMKEKDVLVKYIINQQEHHKQTTFKDEYTAFIKDMGMELDERDWNR